MRIFHAGILSASLLLGFVGALNAEPQPQQATKQPEVAVVSERTELAKFMDNVRALVLREDFAALDRVADQVRSSKARFPGGGWKLTRFYEAVNRGPDPVASSDAEWQDQLALLKRWEKARPKSVTARVAIAAEYEAYAWQARGNGYGNTVTEQGWKVFGERLELAKKELMDAAALPTMCPHWYFVMQQVAMESGASKEQLRAVFEKAVAFEPDYFIYYRLYALSLLPKWGGEPGDVEAFADESYRGLGGKKGAHIYFEIASVLCGVCGEFSPEGFSWPRLQEGFAALEELYGVNPEKLNRYAMLAASYGDKQVAAKTFQRIGPKWDASIWGSRARFEAQRSWAGLTPMVPPAQAETLAPQPVQPSAKASELISLAYKAQSRLNWDDAIRFARQSLDISKHLPNSSEQMGQAYLIMANGKQSQGHWPDAQKLLDDAVSAVSKKWGAESIELAWMLDQAGMSEMSLNDDARAEADLERAMAIREKVNGKLNVDIGSELTTLGSIRHRRGRDLEAIHTFQHAVHIYEAVRPNNPLMISALEQLGYIYQSSGRNADAEHAYLHYLKVQEATFGINSNAVIHPLLKLAEFYKSVGRQEDEAKIRRRIDSVKAISSH